MVSEEECYRTVERGGYYVICPMLPELRSRRQSSQPALTGEYSSSRVTLDHAGLLDAAGALPATVHLNGV